MNAGSSLPQTSFPRPIAKRLYLCGINIKPLIGLGHLVSRSNKLLETKKFRPSPQNRPDIYRRGPQNYLCTADRHFWLSFPFFIIPGTKKQTDFVSYLLPSVQWNWVVAGAIAAFDWSLMAPVRPPNAIKSTKFWLPDAEGATPFTFC